MKPASESRGTLTRIWAKRGTRPRIKRDRRFTWAYLFGAICPARGTGAALVMPVVGIDAMNKHLAEISKCVSVSADPRRCWLAQFATTHRAREYRAHAASALRA
jgi:hypothetical protein